MTSHDALPSLRFRYAERRRRDSPEGGGPRTLMFTSPTVGIGHYGGELDGLGTAYVLATSDGGASWTVATLPAAAQKGISLRYAFASPSGTTDFSARLNLWARDQANVPNRLLAGDALDDDIRIGGDEGFVAYTASGGK